MNGETPLYEYLYASLVTQIEKGALKQGERLPSQQMLCRQYNVGITTVRRTLKMLQQNGYIALSPRRRASVFYKAAPPRYIPRLLAEKEQILDVYNSLAFLTPRLEANGAKRHRDPARLEAIAHSLTRKMNTEYLITRASLFFMELVFPYQNRLLSDLLADSEHFTRLPYDEPVLLPPYYTPQALQQNLLEITKAVRHKDFSFVQMRLEKIYLCALAHMKQYLLELEACYPHKPQNQHTVYIPKKHSCLYAAIACKLYLRIQAGEFKNKRYLPSLAQLTKDYNISVATARYAMALLNDIGAVKTLDKRGSVAVCGEASPPPLRLDNAVIFENLILFLDALQILAICAGVYSRLSIQKLTAEAAAELAEAWRTVLEDAVPSRMVAAALRFLKSHAATPYLADLFVRLETPLIWGHYLERLPQKSRNEKSQSIMEYFKGITAALETRDGDAFAKACALLFGDAFAAARALILMYGAPPARLPVALAPEELLF